ncbi:MAG TPA: acyl-CoA desaturase [Polyangiaceae bacterium]|nr:acyl-CoA desaturase [Polyangiaceae bacterium]
MSFLNISFEPPVRRRVATKLSEYQWLGATPFIAVHLLPLLAFWTGTKWQDWACCVALYWARMFGVTGVYHRYFSHRTYKTSRVFQFLLALLAMSSSQKGVLWWASNHRTHHKLSDKDGDPHDSRRGFWYSHVGWLYDYREATDYSKVRDLARYPELVFLNEYWVIPPVVLGVVVWLALGWSGLLIGFFLSTAILWHGTFTINSLSHMLGTKRYDAGDDSTNNWVLAIVTMGEGWHNNHHHFMGSTRQGFYWWEFDVTYYILRALQAVGLVWDIKEPPARVFDPARQLPKRGTAGVASVASVAPVAADPTPGE